jgi:hypothetical protein
MRIRVKDVLDLLASGVSEKEILEDYPDLESGGSATEILFRLHNMSEESRTGTHYLLPV